MHSKYQRLRAFALGAFLASPFPLLAQPPEKADEPGIVQLLLRTDNPFSALENTSKDGLALLDKASRLFTTGGIVDRGPASSQRYDLTCTASARKIYLYTPTTREYSSLESFEKIASSSSGNSESHIMAKLGRTTRDVISAKELISDWTMENISVEIFNRTVPASKVDEEPSTELQAAACLLDRKVPSDIGNPYMRYDPKIVKFKMKEINSCRWTAPRFSGDALQSLDAALQKLCNQQSESMPNYPDSGKWDKKTSRVITQNKNDAREQATERTNDFSYALGPVRKLEGDRISKKHQSKITSSTTTALPAPATQ